MMRKEEGMMKKYKEECWVWVVLLIDDFFLFKKFLFIILKIEN